MIKINQLTICTETQPANEEKPNREAEWFSIDRLIYLSVKKNTESLFYTIL